MDEIIHHLTVFVSRLWQIHIFGEGNTRTTAVFFIKYLRTLGFEATNDIFAENAWYFRNSLVRANYNDLQNEIHETTEFLEMFLRNLLLNEEHELRNRSMYISKKFNTIQKATIGHEKATIETVMNIINGQTAFNRKNQEHIRMLYGKFSMNGIFGRSDVQSVTGLGSTRAYELIRALLEIKVIQPVSGHGKGKYRFAV